MIKGKTSGGFEFEIDGGVLEDMEFVDALAETVNDNPLAFSNVCAILFGKEQRKRLYDFLRGDDGRVHITAVSDCITRSWTRSETREKTDRPCPYDCSGQKRIDLRHGRDLRRI